MSPQVKSNSILRYFDKRLMFVSALAIVLAGVIPAILLPVRSGMIDSALARDGGFWPCLAAFVALALLQAALANAQERLSKVQHIRSSRNMDSARLKHCSKLPFAFTETEEFFKLNSAAAEASGVLEELYGAMAGILQCAVQLITTIAAIGFVSGYVAMGVVVIIGIGFVLSSVQARRTADLWVNYRQNMRRSDYLSGILLKPEFSTERKIFSYGGEIGSRFDGEYKSALSENSKLGRQRLTLESISQIANAGFIVAALALLTVPLWNGSISLGVFLSTFYAATALLSCSSQLISSIYGCMSSRKKLLPYDELMAQPECAPAKADNPEEFQSLEFRHVSFKYPQASSPVLKDVSFKLERGRHYALVGENGSGKTTILKCLVGLYAPVQGEILLNGRPIADFSRKALMRMLTAVFQDYYRYPLTLRENVTLCAGRMPSDGDIYSAMNALSMEHTLEHLPDGLDSELLLMKDRSVELSGGEWQKLSVLRCILSDSGFAVLDEPNSALDPVVEASIYEAYRRMLGRKTTLFISHRLGSVKVADEILVLKDGRILAQGSHDELVQSSSYYAALFETQKGFYEP